MHGGTSPGAPKGNRNAWKHGKYSAGSKAIARFIREISGSDHLDSELSDVCAGLRVHLDRLHQVALERLLLEEADWTESPDADEPCKLWKVLTEKP